MQKFKLFVKISLLMGLSVFLFLALVTFNIQDNSFNSATTYPTRNIFGVFGAYSTDFLLQYVGISSFLISFFLILWAYLLCTQNTDFLRLKKICFVLQLLLS